MQKLTYVLFQLDEARRYIEDGRLERLRLALLLLDNAAEIHMDRVIRSQIAGDTFKKQIRASALSLPQEVFTDLPEEQRASLRELVEWIPLSSAEEKKLYRYFEEKVNYLAERRAVLDRRLMGPLKYLHTYRNEAYHRAKVRPETIRTAAAILLEVDCQLLLTVGPPMTSWGSDEDYSWLQERFGINVKRMELTDETLRSVLDQIRAGIVPTSESVAVTLAAHLKSRLDTFYEALDFISESTRGHPPREAGLAEAMRRYGQEHARNTPTDRFSLEFLEQICARAARISELTFDRLEAFDTFSAVESDFEPVEECVLELAADVEEAIQIAVDIARGK